jgi:uncharacterized protein
MHIQKTYQTIIDTFVNQIIQTWGDQIERVILFGSVARGQATGESDIDLLIVIKFEDYVLRRQLIGYAYDMFLKTGYMLSVKALSVQDYERERNFSFFSEILAEGVRIA